VPLFSSQRRLWGQKRRFGRRPATSCLRQLSRPFQNHIGLRIGAKRRHRGAGSEEHHVLWQMGGFSGREPQERHLLADRLPDKLETKNSCARTDTVGHSALAACGPHSQECQIRFMVRSPTTRRSILSIRSERSASAALMAAIVCRNVLTFDPSETMPPSTAAIDPMAAT
jgi:hypothetical protein